MTEWDGILMLDSDMMVVRSLVLIWPLIEAEHCCMQRPEQ